MAFVVPNSGLAGDLASEIGFREASAHEPGVVATIVRHNSSAANIAAELDILFNSGSPPTALLVAMHHDVLAVIIYLLRRGISVPDTVSLISRDHDQVFAHVSPPLAQYVFKEGVFSRQLTRLILRLVGQGFIVPEPKLIVPEFFPGGTIKQIPRSG
jgi:DNA-binding LacI/PurR family transcriptional regulator